jgi:hypothetical protein
MPVPDLIGDQARASTKATAYRYDRIVDGRLKAGHDALN